MQTVAQILTRQVVANPSASAGSLLGGSLPPSVAVSLRPSATARSGASQFAPEFRLSPPETDRGARGRRGTVAAETRAHPWARKWEVPANDSSLEG